MRLKPILAAAAIAALAAGAAAAQSAAPDNGMNNQPAAPATADQSGAPASAAISGPVTSSPTPADQAYTLKAGDPNVISNAPVPDTPANRHLFGAPMSNAGRHTKPVGD